MQGLLSDGEHGGRALAKRPAALLGDVCFLHCPKDRVSSLPGFLPFPSPRTDLLSISPQMMIMLGAICAIIVVVIASKYS